MTSKPFESAEPPDEDVTDDLTERDAHYLRQAIALARQARDGGRHPFGSLVVDGHDQVIATAGNNSRPPAGDPTQHAELLAARAAATARPANELASATLYTSAEPCAMCAGAIYWCGIGRVVYALPEASLLKITGAHPENPTLRLPCRVVFASGQRTIAVVGPALVDEAAAVHDGFWSAASGAASGNDGM